jgi:two-component system, OmpR family, phosphate regulon response regulator PhoB
MTPRPRVVVVAPRSTVDALREHAPGIEIDAVALQSLGERARRQRPDTVVVAGSPQPGVIEALRGVREAHRDVRLILVTIGEGSDLRLRALEIGVDDALPPIPIEELAVRLALVARRRTGRRTVRLSVGDGIELDLQRRELLRDGIWVHLRPKEAGLLELFARTPGRTLSRDQILGRVWGPDHRGDPRTVDVHVRWLRDKIEPNPRHPERLVTVRGVGYRLNMPS